MSSHKSNLDLHANQLQNAVLHVLSSAPSTPVEGQMYYDSSLHKALIWNGTAWVEWGGARQEIKYFTVSIPNPLSKTGYLIARLYQDMTVIRVDAHIKTGTSVTFHIQERSSVNIAGSTITNSMITAVTAGTSITAFDDDQLAADNWLYLEIGDVIGLSGVITIIITCSVRN